MNTKNTSLALLSATMIGAINLLSMGAVYIVFSASHKPLQASTKSANIEATAGTNDLYVPNPTVSASVSNGASSVGSNLGSQTASSTPTSTNNQKAPTTSGTAAPTGTKTGGTTGGARGTSTPPPVAPNPAGACSAILSFNSKKDGNPNWDPALVQAIKNGVYSDSRTNLIGGPDKVWAGIQISSLGACSGASPMTVKGKFGYGSFGQPATFTVTWNGSKWIVTNIVQN